MSAINRACLLWLGGMHTIAALTLPACERLRVCCLCIPPGRRLPVCRAGGRDDDQRSRVRRLKRAGELPPSLMSDA
eukprot:1949787-Prymnesium_polylepis.1